MTSRLRTGWPTGLALVLLAGGSVADAPYGDWEPYGIQNVPLHRIGEGAPAP